MYTAEIKRRILDLVANNDLEDAFKLLTNTIRNDKLINDVLIQSAQFKEVERQVRNQLISPENALQLKGRIVANFLSLIQSVELELQDKQEVFNEPANTGNANGIPVFLSVGSTHHDYQKEYIEHLRQHLGRYNIQLETLGLTFWTITYPLDAVRKNMKRMCGCVILAMERFHARDGVYKGGSAQKKDVQDEFFSTPWNQLEAGMAYQEGLPLLLLKEEKLQEDAIFDRGTHEWSILRIRPQRPLDLDADPLKSLIEAWVKEVQKYRVSRQ